MGKLLEGDQSLNGAHVILGEKESIQSQFTTQLDRSVQEIV
jgi:hypothetical protein